MWLPSFGRTRKSSSTGSAPEGRATRGAHDGVAALVGDGGMHRECLAAVGVGVEAARIDAREKVEKDRREFPALLIGRRLPVPPEHEAGDEGNVEAPDHHVAERGLALRKGAGVLVPENGDDVGADALDERDHPLVLGGRAFSSGRCEEGNDQGGGDDAASSWTLAVLRFRSVRHDDCPIPTSRRAIREPRAIHNRLIPTEGNCDAFRARRGHRPARGGLGRTGGFAKGGGCRRLLDGGARRDRMLPTCDIVIRRTRRVDPPRATPHEKGPGRWEHRD